MLLSIFLLFVGNNHRLVVAVKFTPALVYIRFVGTHGEYSKIDVSTI